MSSRFAGRIREILAGKEKTSAWDQEAIAKERNDCARMGQSLWMEFMGVRNESIKLVRSLEASGHFVREGERTAAPVPYEQSVDDYMSMLASTSSLSRSTLGDRANEFERDARAILARHGVTRVRAHLVAEVVWGRPQ